MTLNNVCLSFHSLIPGFSSSVAPFLTTHVHFYARFYLTHHHHLMADSAAVWFWLPWATNSFTFVKSTMLGP